jgi:hypothetical protein
VIDLLLIVVLPTLLLGYAIWRVVQRARQLRELVERGVEASGTVVARETTSRGRGRIRRLRYAYTDMIGRRHEAASLVPDSVWESHAEGGPIEVVYSGRDPALSAPRYLVEQYREALRQRRLR